MLNQINCFINRFINRLFSLRILKGNIIAYSYLIYFTRENIFISIVFRRKICCHFQL